LQLSSLVERLAAQNLDLGTAAERVIQSIAQRRVAVCLSEIKHAHTDDGVRQEMA
jgi:hypothetical protein